MQTEKDGAHQLACVLMRHVFPNTQHLFGLTKAGLLLLSPFRNSWAVYRKGDVTIAKLAFRLRFCERK